MKMNEKKIMTTVVLTFSSDYENYYYIYDNTKEGIKRNINTNNWNFSIVAKDEYEDEILINFNHVRTVEFKAEDEKQSEM